MKNLVKRNTLACYLSDIVLGTYFQLPIWIVYQSSFLSYSQIAFYSGLALIVEVLAQLPTGAFADLVGRKYALSLGNLFMALPMFLIALYPSPNIMLLYAFMWGLGRAFCMGTSKPILYETLSLAGMADRYPRTLSKSIVFFQFSAAISITLGGYLYQVSPNLPYLFSGFASLIGIFTSLIFIEPTRQHSISSLRQFITTSRSGLHEIIKNSYIAKLTLLYALTIGIAQSSQQFLSQPYMVELGMGDITRSWAAMIIKISIALLGAKVVATAKLFNHRHYLIFIPILMIISYLPASVAVLPWAYIILVGIAFNSGNTEVFLSPEINQHLNSSVRSTAISIQRMLASSFGAIVQWLSIYVVMGHSVGTYYAYLGLFTLFIVIPLAYNLSSHRHKLRVSPIPSSSLPLS